MIKKALFSLFTIVIVLLMVACKDEITSIIAIVDNDFKTEYYYGENLDYENVKLKISYKSGSETIVDGRSSTSTYNEKPAFDHFGDINQVKEQEISFIYQGKESDNKIIVTTLLRPIESVTCLGNGKTNYFVNEYFDVTGFNLLVKYQDGDSEFVNLDLSMIKSDNNHQLVSSGLVALEIKYFGVTPTNTIHINVNKANRVLVESDVKFTKDSNSISVEQIENGLYALYEKDATPNNGSVNWQESSFFSGLKENFTYVLFVKTKETTTHLESNIITKEILIEREELDTPLVFDVGETNIVFSVKDNLIVYLDGPWHYKMRILNESFVEFYELTPNTNYIFKNKNENLISKPITVKTKMADNPFLVQNIKQDYNGLAYSFEINYNADYSHLSKDLEIIYLKDEIAQLPIDVGVYEVYAKHSFNDIGETKIGVLTITPKSIQVSVLSKEIEYMDQNPYLENILDYLVFPSIYDDKSSFSIILEDNFLYDLGTYEVVPTITHKNYLISVRSGILTVVKKHVTIKMNDVTITYDSAFVANGYTFVDCDELNFAKDHDDTLLVNYASINTNLDVGYYKDLVDATITNPYYHFTVIKGNLSIIKKDVTVTVNNYKKTYGDADPNYLFELSIEKYRSQLVDVYVYRDDNQNAGIHNLLINGLDSQKNFNLIFLGATLTIEKRKIELTADNQTIVYQGLITDVNLNLKPNNYLYFNDKIEDFTVSISDTNLLNVGLHQIDINVTHPNYLVTTDKLTVNVTKKEVILVFNETIFEKTYQNEDPVFGYSLSENIILEGYPSREANENVGLYELNLGTLNHQNYYITIKEEAYLLINPKEVIVVANSSSKIYGDFDPIIDYATSVEVTLLGSLSRISGETVGKYAVTLGTLSANNDNYILKLDSNSYFTIKQRESVVSFDNYENLYYQGMPFMITATATNLLATHSVKLEGHLEINASDAPYQAKASIFENGIDVTSNYKLINETLDYYILKSTIEVRVINMVRQFGSENPEPRAYLYDLNYNETISNKLLEEIISTSNIVFNIDADINSPAGSYSITVFGYESSNYEFIYIAGTLTVTMKSVSITLDSLSSVYDGNIKNLTASVYSPTGELYLGGVVSFVCTLNGKEEALLNAGLYLVNVYFTDPSGNYLDTEVSFSYEIQKQNVNVVWHDLVLVYNGFLQAPSYTVKDMNDNDLDCNLIGYRTNVGLYSAKVTLVNDRNYQLLNDSVSFEIKPYEITSINWENLVLVYNGLNQMPSANASGLLGEEVLLMVSGGKINVGNYQALAESLDNNYLVSQTTTYQIIKRDLTIIVDDTKLYYNGLSQSPLLSAEELISGHTIKILQNINAGTYQSNIQIFNNTNNVTNQYNLNISTVNYTIYKFRLVVEITTNLIYNGYEQIPSHTIINSDLNIPVLKTGFGKDVGSYNLQIDSLDENYTIDNPHHTFVISKMGVTPDIGATTLIYNGSYQTPDINIYGIFGEELLFNLSEGLKDVGTKTILITLDSSVNNYYLISDEVMITVVAKEVFASLAKESNIYDGTSHLNDNILNVTGLVLEDTYSLDYPLAINAGVYNITLRLSDNYHISNQQEITFSYQVLKAKIVFSFQSVVIFEGSNPDFIDVTLMAVNNNLDLTNFTYHYVNSPLVSFEDGYMGSVIIDELLYNNINVIENYQTIVNGKILIINNDTLGFLEYNKEDKLDDLSIGYGYRDLYYQNKFIDGALNPLFGMEFSLNNYYVFGNENSFSIHTTYTGSNPEYISLQSSNPAISIIKNNDQYTFVGIGDTVLELVYSYDNIAIIFGRLNVKVLNNTKNVSTFNDFSGATNLDFALINGIQVFNQYLTLQNKVLYGNNYEYDAKEFNDQEREFATLIDLRNSTLNNIRVIGKFANDIYDSILNTPTQEERPMTLTTISMSGNSKITNSFIAFGRYTINVSQTGTKEITNTTIYGGAASIVFREGDQTLLIDNVNLIQEKHYDPVTNNEAESMIGAPFIFFPASFSNNAIHGVDADYSNNKLVLGSLNMYTFVSKDDLVYFPSMVTLVMDFRKLWETEQKIEKTIFNSLNREEVIHLGLIAARVSGGPYLENEFDITFLPNSPLANNLTSYEHDEVVFMYRGYGLVFAYDSSKEGIYNIVGHLFNTPSYSDYDGGYN